jgi:hypothetical protein
MVYWDHPGTFARSSEWNDLDRFLHRVSQVE